jgi:hypothetical protein
MVGQVKKKLKDIGNRIRGLQACNIVPPPTTLSRAPHTNDKRLERGWMEQNGLDFADDDNLLRRIKLSQECRNVATDLGNNTGGFCNINYVSVNSLVPRKGLEIPKTIIIQPLPIKFRD